jgi:hypothetical protein
MEKRFNELMEILKNPNKEKRWYCFTDSTPGKKIELIVQIEDFFRSQKKKKKKQFYNRLTALYYITKKMENRK